MPPSVPLETFVLTLHVPRTISDADVSTLLKQLRRKTLWRRLHNAITQVLQTLPASAPITVSISPSP